MVKHFRLCIKAGNKGACHPVTKLNLHLLSLLLNLANTAARATSFSSLQNLLPGGPATSLAIMDQITFVSEANVRAKRNLLELLLLRAYDLDGDMKLVSSK
jgi:hypothetical protein